MLPVDDFSCPNPLHASYVSTQYFEEVLCGDVLQTTCIRIEQRRIRLAHTCLISQTNAYTAEIQPTMARIETRIHTPMWSPKHSYPRTRTHTHSYTPTHIYTQARANAQVNEHTLIYSLYTHTHTFIQTLTHIHT